MFNVDDYIMYGMTGVCKVVDITNEKFINGEKRKYYVLNPIYNNDTTIKVPLDNDKIPMRKVISKGDMTSLINDIPNMEILWIDDEKKRMAQFETMLKSGQCEELIKLIKNIKFSKKYARSNDKKLYKSDKDIMKEAKRLLTEEFAIILNIYPKEANSYILSQIH
ncbi:CarD family transcriptional regulator [Paraclostridium sordellii]|uniref:Regulatory protein n=1 Tax=Paraclostridium sordellii TaxID=1505 RepID=A0A0C7R463_PARSO|nr:CarD family transcriptional regulator [Paeniclostridium sordellii]QYE99586.1 CarD family transcriptional regulator [Paeniclostridium sordellii]CEN78408.1 regulatory protein [[Clostridium] sordellii] [Paeniclostridium sordellii]CEO08473.1 regulatory protein [[Clostridium] sordellii] [Paeniclostridium sordellii]CEP87221.1 regulatory protein [[Clostridium] sordellii] [Paeniclostridium sordellii]CEP95562.1 regulatory protein [[Clostridium] sordellii] [Paeniclostridium sordellii]